MGEDKGWSRGTLLEVWKQSEMVAMHFNELLIKLRLRALAAVAASIAIVGAAVGSKDSPLENQWDLLICASLILIVAWVAIATIDRYYYSRLLAGAVDSLLEIEQRTEGIISLSTRIEDFLNPKNRNPKNRAFRWPQWTFYFLGLFILAVTFLFGWWMRWEAEGERPSAGAARGLRYQDPAAASAPADLAPPSNPTKCRTSDQDE